MSSIPISIFRPGSDQWIEYTENTEFRHKYCKCCLNGNTNGNLTITIDDSNPRYLGKTYNVYSVTNHAHEIEITGNLTWDGSNKVAKYDGNVGSFIDFIVLKEDLIVVKNSQGVSFQ
jgi:hypothetical protein